VSHSVRHDLSAVLATSILSQPLPSLGRSRDARLASLSSSVDLTDGDDDSSPGGSSATSCAGRPRSSLAGRRPHAQVAHTSWGTRLGGSIASPLTDSNRRPLTVGKGQDPANRATEVASERGDFLLDLSTQPCATCRKTTRVVAVRRAYRRCVRNVSACSVDRQQQSVDLQALWLSPLTDSNRRPPPYHGGALPTELRGQRPQVSRSSRH
jgi:hypothetical protein